MKGLGRNDTCWCGSGKKYKKCHLDRSLQERGNPWDAVAANKKAFHAKKCAAKDVGLGDCEGRIIKAHTVSRGPNLVKIARNGKVTCYTADPSRLIKNGGKLDSVEIGIADASVFYGFCSKHDRTLFSCIENEPFNGRADQCLAVAYRTLSREFYGKDAGSHLRETLRNADKGRTLIEQVRLQALLDMIDQGNDLAKKDLANTYEKLTSALVEGQGEALRSIIIEFEGMLPFMVAGAWSPFTDFYGDELQKGFADENLEQIFISSFAGSDWSKICISWLNKPDAPGKVIADQICMLPKTQQSSACLQLSVKHVENIFYSPVWFDSLNETELEQLYMLASSGVDTMGSVPDARINLDLKFGLTDNSRILTLPHDE
ncbi:SEC-C domain-containing protein [Mesorhizobium sp. SB112]|uniref:SEC-C domain-containing protein n=1 Tax=Mesorhizobium sp. SB112 TaxID=3151853 RepID=UPI0032650FA6